jgi:alkanesulfonate monooxygenase SsuD/methylene tetrahydromethanopterin reductase-like flavin-dependent oxidoreductase (luciferase family)
MFRKVSRPQYRQAPARVEALFAVGRDMSPDELNRGWAESLELLHLALTGRDFTFDGAFRKVTRPTTIATRPLQDPLPMWLGGSSLDTMGRAAERGWSTVTPARART